MNKQNTSPHLIQQARLKTVLIQEESVQIYLPDPLSVQEAYSRGEIAFPYWSKIWPAAIALGEFLHLHSHLIKNKNVLELGAGLGLPSLIAARYAAFVTCTDHAPEAVAFASLSAANNKLTNFRAEVLDWNYLPENVEADVILFSDINYEPTAFAALMKIISFFMLQEKIIVLSTPQRLMAKEFISTVLPYCKHQEERSILHNGNDVAISVLVLQN